MVDKLVAENCAAKFVKLGREKIGLEVSDDTVDRANRVGKKEEGARAIFVCLKRHKDKLTIMKNGKNLKDSGFYINEDLTKSNQKLFYTARVKCVLMLIPPGLRTGRLL